MSQRLSGQETQLNHQQQSAPALNGLGGGSRLPVPSVETLRELFDYNPETGSLTWRERPATTWRMRGWNTRFAGQAAGSPNTNGYLQVPVAGRLLFVHRIAWKIVHGGEPPAEIDHINLNRADNRIANLRAACATMNKANRPVQRNSFTGIKGITLVKGGRFRARVMLNRREYYVGTFDTAEKAKQARDAKAREIHGEFFRP